MACSSSKQLFKLFSTPSKIANTLDWKKQIGGSIATINVHADRIGLTISHHPENSNHHLNDNNGSFSSPLSSLSSSSLSLSSSSVSSSSFSYSLPLNRKGKRKIPNSSRHQLSELVQDHNVCGFVVSWPVQQDTGLMGASCGRTLNVMEELLLPSPVLSDDELVVLAQQQHRPDDRGVAVVDTADCTMSPPSVAGNVDAIMFVTPQRPICLWDSSNNSTNNHNNNNNGIDTSKNIHNTLGRYSVFARTSTKKSQCASNDEQHYHREESIFTADQVWEDFAKKNWPEIKRQHRFRATTSSSSISSETKKKYYYDNHHYGNNSLLSASLRSSSSSLFQQRK